MASLLWLWFASTVSLTLSFIALVILFLIHSYRFLSIFQSKIANKNENTDFKNQQKNDTRIKLSGIIRKKEVSMASNLTYVSMILFLFVLGLWTCRFMKFIIPACDIIIKLASTLYITAKAFMYLVFVLRLDLVYRGSAHEYNQKSLIAFSVIMLVWNLSGVIANFFTIGSEVTHYKSVDVWGCSGQYHRYAILIVASLDLICSVGFMLAFILPLKKLIHSQTASKSVKQKKIKRLMNVGHKAAILTSSACLTTVILMVLGGIGFGSIFSGIDIVTNVLSLMLMTKYYAKGKYLNFKKLCCCMLMFCRISLRLPKSPTMVLTISTTVNETETYDTNNGGSVNEASSSPRAIGGSVTPNSNKHDVEINSLKPNAETA